MSVGHHHPAIADTLAPLAVQAAGWAMTLGSLLDGSLHALAVLGGLLLGLAAVWQCKIAQERLDLEKADRARSAAADVARRRI